MFQGRFEHNLDDKGRVAVPAAFRKRLASDASEKTGEGGDTAPNEATVIVTISDQCLAAYPMAEWERKLSQIAKLNQFDPKVMAFKRIFVGCAQECPVDKAGRILVPADLRRDAGIERECMFVGQIEKFEIWSAERWRRSFDQLSDQVGAIYASLADHGIQL
jgi:MraZ protein